MIHPGLDDVGLEPAKMARETEEAARVGDTGLHADRVDGDAGSEDGGGDGEVVDQGDDGEAEALAIGAQQEVTEHRLGAAELKAVNDVEEVKLLRHARSALPV